MTPGTPKKSRKRGQKSTKSPYLAPQASKWPKNAIFETSKFSRFLKNFFDFFDFRPQKCHFFKIFAKSADFGGPRTRQPEVRSGRFGAPLAQFCTGSIFRALRASESIPTRSSGHFVNFARFCPIFRGPELREI